MSTAKIVTIHSDYITLAQFLKLTSMIDSGGSSKYFLNTNAVLVNSQLENRRGCKLRRGDTITVNQISFTIQ
ncbi:MAG: RNA-binding S4 domain-containing protein [Mycoplasmataceae bacterium]|jgi:ribosome-associated protein|nr:RNA-binding S4 domain-containing protein [Mycoplasmataceae bacterium]